MNVAVIGSANCAKAEDKDYLWLIRDGRSSLRFVFLYRITHIELYVPQQSAYLIPETLYPQGNLASAARIRMDSFAVFFAEVMVEQIDKMKKVIEHRLAKAGA